MLLWALYYEIGLRKTGSQTWKLPSPLWTSNSFFVTPILHLKLGFTPDAFLYISNLDSLPPDLKSGFCTSPPPPTLDINLVLAAQAEPSLDSTAAAGGKTYWAKAFRQGSFETCAAWGRQP